MTQALLSSAWRSVVKSISQKVGITWAPNPGVVYLIVNSSCNAKCLMCDVGQMNRSSQFYQVMARTELGLDTLKKVLHDIKLFRPIIAITSIEPLLYRYLMDAVQLIKANGLRCELTTNGLLLPRFASRLVEAGVDSITVSIDGPPQIHDRIRGVPGIFEKAAAGIEALLNSRRKPKVSISSTISPLNQEHIYETARVVAELGVDAHVFTHLNFVTKEMKEAHNACFSTTYPATESSVAALDPQAVNTTALSREIERTTKQFDKVVFSPNLQTVDDIDVYYHRPLSFIPGHRRCNAIWSVAEITADGYMLPSTRCFNIDLGNIKDQPFAEIWNGQRMRAFRRDLAANGGAFPACARCCGVM